jgi:hypothetical protein
MCAPQYPADFPTIVAHIEAFSLYQSKVLMDNIMRETIVFSPQLFPLVIFYIRLAATHAGRMASDYQRTAIYAPLALGSRRPGRTKSY